MQAAKHLPKAFFFAPAHATARHTFFDKTWVLGGRAFTGETADSRKKQTKPKMKK
jgi:hypothetical protein